MDPMERMGEIIVGSVKRPVSLSLMKRWFVTIRHLFEDLDDTDPIPIPNVDVPTFDIVLEIVNFLNKQVPDGSIVSSDSSTEKKEEVQETPLTPIEITMLDNLFGTEINKARTEAMFRVLNCLNFLDCFMATNLVVQRLAMDIKNKSDDFPFIRKQMFGINEPFSKKFMREVARDNPWTGVTPENEDYMFSEI